MLVLYCTCMHVTCTCTAARLLLLRLSFTTGVSVIEEGYSSNTNSRVHCGGNTDVGVEVNQNSLAYSFVKNLLANQAISEGFRRPSVSFITVAPTVQ